MPLLTLTRHGSPTDLPTLLIAHGLFGSGRNWGAIAKRLSDSREVIAVDMRNHANSFWDDDHSYPAMAADLAAVIDTEGHPMDVLGHSMGGKAAMLLSLLLSALGVWLAENLGTLTGTWLYDGQETHDPVSFATLGSWYLFLCVALMVALAALPEAAHPDEN